MTREWPSAPAGTHACPECKARITAEISTMPRFAELLFRLEYQTAKPPVSVRRSRGAAVLSQLVRIRLAKKAKAEKRKA